MKHTHAAATPYACAACAGPSTVAPQHARCEFIPHMLAAAPLCHASTAHHSITWRSMAQHGTAQHGTQAIPEVTVWHLPQNNAKLPLAYQSSQTVPPTGRTPLAKNQPKTTPRQKPLGQHLPPLQRIRPPDDADWSTTESGSSAGHALRASAAAARACTSGLDGRLEYCELTGDAHACTP